MKRAIWYCETPAAETITVIAESADEAIAYTADFCDDDELDGYEAQQAPAEVRRWVGFDSPSDADNQARDLDAAGVTVDRILMRETRRPGIGPALWEVGARDADWCRLPSGVLCGGDS